MVAISCCEKLPGYSVGHRLDNVHTPSSSTAMKFHLAIFTMAFSIANSAPYGLVRRQGAGFESIVVYAVPTSPAVSDQSYSSSSIGQNYYSPSSPPSYSSPISDPIDVPYNTVTFCRHGITSTSERNHRQRERMTYQPVVRATFKSRNNSPYSSGYGDEKNPAHRRPNYSVRDSFESSHRQNNHYGRDNSRVSQAPMYGQTGSSYEAFTIHQKFPTSRTVMGYRLLPSSSMRRGYSS